MDDKNEFVENISSFRSDLYYEMNAILRHAVYTELHGKLFTPLHNTIPKLRMVNHGIPTY